MAKIYKATNRDGDRAYLQNVSNAVYHDNRLLSVILQELQPKEDDALETKSNNIVDAINELFDNKADKTNVCNFDPTYISNLNVIPETPGFYYTNENTSGSFPVDLTSGANFLLKRCTVHVMKFNDNSGVQVLYSVDGTRKSVFQREYTGHYIDDTYSWTHAVDPEQTILTTVNQQLTTGSYKVDASTLGIPFDVIGEGILSVIMTNVETNTGLRYLYLSQDDGIDAYVSKVENGVYGDFVTDKIDWSRIVNAPTTPIDVYTRKQTDALLETHNTSDVAHADIRTIVGDSFQQAVYDKNTSTLSLTTQSGEIKSVVIENIGGAQVIDGYVDADSNLILVMSEGLPLVISLAQMHDQYYGSESATINVVVDAGNIIWGQVREESIAKRHLDSNIVTLLDSIPTSTSDLVNDSQFVTQVDLDAHNADTSAHAALKNDIIAEIAPVYTNALPYEVGVGFKFEDNHIYSPVISWSTFDIGSASGYGILHFKAGPSAVFTLPAGHSWDGGVEPIFEEGKTYNVTYTEFGTWYADGGR